MRIPSWLGKAHPQGPSPLAGEGWVGGTNEGKLPPAGLGPSLTGRLAEWASRADGLVSPADGLKSFLDPPHPASPARGEGPEEEPFRPRGFASRVARGEGPPAQSPPRGAEGVS